MPFKTYPGDRFAVRLIGLALDYEKRGRTGGLRRCPMNGVTNGLTAKTPKTADLEPGR